MDWGAARLLDERAGKAIGAIWGGSGGAGYSSLSSRGGLHTAAHGGLIVLPWTAGDVFCQPVLERFACGASR